ncbi:hypothetical protein CKO31_13670 [Thiohalocapsa halophila]|uniref:Uncharacterized protein n=1 Tax=Thiohalocapsa halophila TaxID=69359 RepID=A0ABS1CK95_9GAMM|nr:hypothetical protein [Thiohalocapsa halophila]MBK1631766.1 hypothetical protein [Thiohalocapsa halophila]
METDIWNQLPLTELPQGVALRQALLERLVKAGGHINAAERKLWHDTDRSPWSARQATARIAEVWLWLGEHDEAAPDVGRYLDRETTSPCRRRAYRRSRPRGAAGSSQCPRSAAWACANDRALGITPARGPTLARALQRDRKGGCSVLGSMLARKPAAQVSRAPPAPR